MRFIKSIYRLTFTIIILMTVNVYAQEESLTLSKNQSHSMLEYYTLNHSEQAWEKDPFYLYFSPQENISGEEFNSMKNEVNDWVNQWKALEQKNNRSITKKLFNKTRQKFLKGYKECSTFSDLLEDGTYDCLSGTLLFAHIFQELGYEYSIHQNNSHVYIIVEDPYLGKTLIESTDIYGYVIGKNNIESRIKGYEKRLENSLLYSRYGMNLTETLSIKDVAGLQYYNLAVASYRANDLYEAKLSLYKASIITDSPRIGYFNFYLEESNNLISAMR
ncbi:hypothetical protein [Flammeovirga sp. SJP92]|uniref:hypothetical protein n=1 Tax=Flammeovirga sp. SJP92 TaxID=1775430 RepID=UPI0012FCDC3C|nr:hypothetical protein [Flammeovirga sp. SJP92]